MENGHVFCIKTAVGNDWQKKSTPDSHQRLCLLRNLRVRGDRQKWVRLRRRRKCLHSVPFLIQTVEKLPLCPIEQPDLIPPPDVQ